MQKIVYLKHYQNHKPGEVALVTNNVALGLVEKGIAVLFRNYHRKMLRRARRDKMMRPETSLDEKQENPRYKIK